jgi:putative hydrolase of HD superfamily
MHSPRLQALLTLQTLQDLPRTGWIQHGVADPERIAGHILGAQYLAMSLHAQSATAINLGRVLELLLVHDAPESVLGDWPRSAAGLLPPGAKAHAESKAADQVLSPLSAHARELFREYSEGRTAEARFARLCDRLQLAVRLYGYRLRGQGGLEDFEAGLESLDASDSPEAQSLLTELRGLLAAVASRRDPA